MEERVVATKGRPIRLATPDRCKPYYSGKVVGVGESIGTVYALLGEGIIPSMQCVDIFIRKHARLSKHMKKQLKNITKFMPKFLNFVRAKIHHDFNFLKGITRFYCNIQIYEKA